MIHLSRWLFDEFHKCKIPFEKKKICKLINHKTDLVVISNKQICMDHLMLKTETLKFYTLRNRNLAINLLLRLIANMRGKKS